MPDIQNVPQAAQVIGETRVWAVCERSQKRGVVRFWRNVASGLKQ